MTRSLTLDEALAALAESESRHQVLFDTSAAIQLMVDGETGTIVHVNSAAERFYGWPIAALCSMLVTDLDGTSLQQWRAEAPLAHRNRESLQRSHRVAAGPVRAVDTFPVCVNVGSRTLVHLIVHDIHERASAEAALRSAELHLGTLRERAAATGHDVNNVLTVMRGSTAFLQDALAPDSPSHEDIAALERAADRCEALVRGLVELVRLG